MIMTAGLQPKQRSCLVLILKLWPLAAFSHPFSAIHFQLVVFVAFLLEGPLADDLSLVLKNTGYELSFQPSKYVTSVR